MPSSVQSGISIALKSLACCTVLAMALSPSLAQAGARLDLLPQRWTDDVGSELKLSDLRGRRVILTMAYASCHYICPMTLDGLLRMQQVLDARGEQASIIVVGYDPKNDKPSDWHHYRTSHRLSRPNWHFLSGSEEVTRDLAGQLGFSFWKYDEHVMHESRVVVFGADGALQIAINTPTADWPTVL
jgi:cytochrome oxidase Cu insertion factor (SCO1/SenC/PrrC family)